MKKIFQYIILLALVIFWVNRDAKAITYYSVKDGYWNNTTTWQGGVLPDLADTVIIRHIVIFTQDLNVPSTGYIQIDSAATLCGINSIETDCGSYFYNWGTVKADTVIITDGGNYGFIHALNQYSVSPCLITTYIGAALIGGTFSCILPTSIIEQDVSDEVELNVIPNPFFDRLNFDLISETQEDNLTIILLDYTGRIILKNIVDKTGHLDLSSLSSGIYILKVLHNERWYVKSVIKG